jgi:hypothetical protein
MKEQGRPSMPNVTPLPFDLPEAFAERLRYRHERRLVGIHTNGGRCTITDGVDTLVGADHHVYGELMRQTEVQDWLAEHEVELGSSYGPPTHWLLVDRLENRAYISPAGAARDKVRTQRLEE